MSHPRRSHPLTREELVAAALGIVDSEGLAALTMRRLAEVLGVEAMSLYHHVANKDVLLDWTVDRVRSEMRLDNLPENLPENWIEILEAIFVELRRVLAAHPNMLPIATRKTGASASGLTFLMETGFGRDEAVDIYQSLVAFTIGYALLSSYGPTSDWPALPADLNERMRDWRDETFRRGLRSIMEGLGSKQGVG